MTRHFFPLFCVGAALFTPACSGVDGDEEIAEAADGLRALTPAEILGSLAYGETSAPVPYSKTPLYRAFQFDGKKGDDVEAWVRSNTGDARAWLLSPGFTTLAENQNASSSTKDARVATKLPATGTYYVAFRDSARKSATFTVSLAKQGGACAVPLVREERWIAGPSGRPSGPSIFDSARNRIVVFTKDGTSELVAAGYSPPTGDGLPPGDHSEAAIAYDSSRGRAVLFGGRDPQTNTRLGDTWEWDGASWTKMTPSGFTPRARDGHALAYDPIRKKVVLYGGMADSEQMEDTWTWDGASWTRVGTKSQPHPEPRYGHRMVFDASRGHVVLFGQYGGWMVGPVGGPNSSKGNTWAWDGGAWTEVGGAVGSFTSDHSATLPMVYDTRRGRLVRLAVTGQRYQGTLAAYELVPTAAGRAEWRAFAAKDPPSAGMSSYGWRSGVYDPLRERFVIDGVELATVELENRAPALAPVADTRVFVGDTLEIDLGATDADGHPVTYGVSPMPAGARIDSFDGRFSFSPSASQVGTLTLKATASDGCEAGERTFRVKVEVGSYAGLPSGDVRYQGELSVSGATLTRSSGGSYTAYPKLSCALSGENPGKVELTCDGPSSNATRYPSSTSFTPAAVRVPLENDLSFARRDSDTQTGSTFVGRLEPLSDGTLRVVVAAWSVPTSDAVGRVGLGERGSATGVLDRP